ncbi:hypothetical protein Mgra_00003522 [Meloidogyne graminicola]|uniref:Uncharacterized protein n=1 Tax=Meloidogyne graminicola TaxID=189291 RepID=A0A8S9ZVH8_9BILA|nr:hypothetical protein Mgra_00003522 [Meloidogyne graminicola]
MDWCLKPAP